MMDVVILCGYQGSCQREVTIYKPKPIVEIGEKQIIWSTIKLYSYDQYYDFILAFGYKSEVRRDYFLNY